MSLKLPTVRVRARVVAGGAMLGGALLVGTALVGGVDDAPGGSAEPEPARLGPATAIQPELREALLTDQDLPPTAHDDHGAPRAERPTRPAAGDAAPPAARVPATETGALTELCRALFDDPAGLVRLWRTPPEEITSSDTKRPGGATLHQVLGVFEGGRSIEAYQRLREATFACNRFETTLGDGSPVIVLLEELSASRPESAAADDSYSMLIALEGSSRSGWLTVDRIGPVVSVLRQVGPAGSSSSYDDDSPGQLARARSAALDKLRPLLRALKESAG